jgi:4-amino-4-deoxy-L-arabinose transferase-like glycosyltransferase
VPGAGPARHGSLGSVRQNLALYNDGACVMTEPTHASPRGGRARTTGVLAALVVVGSAYFSLPPGIRNWDNLVKLQVASNMLSGEGPVLTRRTPDDQTYVVQGRDGRRYADYPPFAYVLQFLTIGLPGAGGGLTEGIPALALLGLLAWVLVAWGLRSGTSPPAAAAGAMLVCLGTALWPMTARGDDNLIESLGLATILLAGTGEERPRAWLWAGLAVGMAFATRMSAVLLAIPALLLLLGSKPRHVHSVLRRGLSFVVGAAPGITLVLWYNHLRFGSPFISHSETDLGTVGQVFVPWLSRYHWEGMVGLTISPGKGIVWYGPPLLGVVRRHRVAFSALCV